MKKTILIVLVVVLAVVGVVAYWLWSQAQKDTENITQLQEEKLSKEELEKMAEKKADDFQAVQKAAEQAGELSVDKQIEMWETQLGSDQAPIRMKAVAALAELHDQAPAKVEELLRKVAADDADEDVQMGAEMMLEELAGVGDGADVTAEDAQ